MGAVVLLACPSHNEVSTGNDAAPEGATAERRSERAGPSPAQVLGREPAAAREQLLAAGETQAYEIALEAGEYLRFEVDQRGVDVVVALFSPSGSQMIEVDSPTGATGKELLEAVAEARGLHRLEVRSWDGQGDGAYGFRLAALRPATETDRRLASAAGTFAAAEDERRRKEPGSLRQALADYERSLALFQEVGDVRWQAEAWHRLGWVHELLGETESAFDADTQALTRFRELGEELRAAELLQTLGDLAADRGEVGRALDTYRQARVILAREGDRHGEAVLLNDLALILKSTGAADEALSCYDEALELWRTLGDHAREATTLSNVGRLYLTLGRFELAADTLRRALALRRQVGDLRGEAITLGNLGIAYRKRLDLEEAEEHFRLALALWRRLEDRGGEASALEGLARTLFQRDRAQEALALHQEALALFEETGNPVGQAVSLLHIGTAYDSDGKPQEALPCFGRALGIFRRIGDRSGTASALLATAWAQRLNHEPEAARASVEEALEIVESLRVEPRSVDLRSSYFATRQQYYSLYIDLLMELHDRQPAAGFDALALEATERTWARSLLDLLTEGSPEIREPADEGLLAREQALARRLETTELERLEAVERGSSPAALRRFDGELRRLLLEADKVDAEIRTANSAYAAISRPRPLRLDEIRGQLLGDTQLVAIKLGEERSFLWLVSRTTLESHPLPPRREIEAAVRQVHRALSKSHARSMATQARLATAALGEMLLAPVKDRLTAERLVVVADGALRYIPFAALPVPSGQGEGATLAYRPLVTRYEVVNLPSVSVLAALRSQITGRRPAPETLAVLADPVFSAGDPRVRSAQAATNDAERPSFPRLPYSRREAEAILALVPAGQRFAALDFAANHDTALRPELGRFKVVHFATHALIHAEHPELSGVVLSLVDEEGRARNGFLRAHEIHHLRLQSDLVTLSGCRTALGREIRGEGLVGLTRSFLSAGAVRMLVSLWNVNDQATAELMTRFYRAYLVDGLRPAAALRTAQLSMLEDQRWEAPSCWAGFVLQGEWQ